MWFSAPQPCFQYFCWFYSFPCALFPFIFCFGFYLFMHLSESLLYLFLRHFAFLLISVSSHFSGEYHGTDQGGGHHHLHSQKKVYHVGYGHQSCWTSLWANEVWTTGRRHFSSFFEIIHPGNRPWSRQAVVTACQIKKQLGNFILDLWFLRQQVSFIRQDRNTIWMVWISTTTRYRNYSVMIFLMLVWEYLNLKSLIALHVI